MTMNASKEETKYNQVLGSGFNQMTPKDLAKTNEVAERRIGENTISILQQRRPSYDADWDKF